MDRQKDILVSIIVTVYNNERHIKKCLDEIVPQLNSKNELIIIDDGSFDSTVDICKQITRGKETVSIISNKHNGLSNSRNIGIKKLEANMLYLLMGMTGLINII